MAEGLCVPGCTAVFYVKIFGSPIGIAVPLREIRLPNKGTLLKNIKSQEKHSESKKFLRKTGTFLVFLTRIKYD